MEQVIGFEDVNVTIIDTIWTFKMLENKALTKHEINSIVVEVVEGINKKMKIKTL